tara:strand:+ start:343 stop:513 length:171 start_codon:yes stop_codon:yes gene_type:complete
MDSKKILEEIKLTFGDWIKKHLTAKQVEKIIQNSKKDTKKEKDSESIVVLTKGTKW